MPFTKQCQELGRKLRAAGMSQPEIIRAVDAYEARLMQENAAIEHQAPEGTTPRALAAINLDRACQGLAPLQPHQNDRPNTSRALSDREISAINLERALLTGGAPMSATEIARENLRRASALEHVAGERAPKGTHPTALARENLRRACSGEPALLPHEDD